MPGPREAGALEQLIAAEAGLDAVGVSDDIDAPVDHHGALPDLAPLLVSVAQESRSTRGVPVTNRRQTLAPS